MNEKETFTNETTEQPKPVTNQITVKEKTLIFDEAHPCASAKATVEAGTKLNVLAVGNGFKKVSYGKNKEGFIHE